MDIEFHYYITYLIAVRAGFRLQDAEIIAYSSQYVDDNNYVYEVRLRKGQVYQNYISQTLDITQPKDKLYDIYPLFHFIPGNRLADSAKRQDGNIHKLNTTPNSKSVQEIIGAALSSGNLYRIGIAAHTFVDTWAHQNFIGINDEFNSINKDLLQGMIPNIGHADVMHSPDWPGCEWIDPRLIKEKSTIVNTDRFLSAAKGLFKLFRKYNGHSTTGKGFNDHLIQLQSDLRSAIGKKDNVNKHSPSRILRYQKLAEKEEYGRNKLTSYQKFKWKVWAVKGPNRSRKTSARKYEPFSYNHTWKDPKNYADSYWYQFQESVKEHQKFAKEVLKGVL